jgi:hypothetical protein
MERVPEQRVRAREVKNKKIGPLMVDAIPTSEVHGGFFLFLFPRHREQIIRVFVD